MIPPTHMDGNCTPAGYDLESMKAVADVVTGPVEASDGARQLEHFYETVV